MAYLPQIYTDKEYPHVTEEEAIKVWQHAKLPYVRLFIKTLWYTGLRINEVLAIKIKDLAPVENGFDLSITREKKEKPKVEVLPIPLELGIELRDYAKTAGLKANDKFFPGHENAYRYQVKQCAKRARLQNWQKIHPHLFRHGFVYQKVLEKVHPMVLSKLVGHSSLNTTMQYYQPTREDLRNAMEK